MRTIASWNSEKPENQRAIGIDERLPFSTLAVYCKIIGYEDPNSSYDFGKDIIPESSICPLCIVLMALLEGRRNGRSYRSSLDALIPIMGLDLYDRVAYLHFNMQNLPPHYVDHAALKGFPS